LRKFSLLLALILFSGCIQYIKPVIEIKDLPLYAWDMLKRQKSFLFEYCIFKKSISLNIKLKGVFNTPDIFEIKGEWREGEESEDVHLIGVGDFEFERKGNKWELHARGEESRVFTQVERVFGYLRKRKKVEVVDSSGEFYILKFHPNLAFLDPSFSKRMQGLVFIEKRRYTLKKIECSSEDGDIGFRFEVKKVNRAKKIKIPFVVKREVVYRVKKNPREAEKMIRRRIKEVGLNAKVKREKNLIRIQGDLSLTKKRIRMLSSPGKVCLVLLSLEEEGAKISVKNNPADIFYIKDTLLKDDIKEVRVIFDELSRPMLFVHFKKKIPGIKEYYVGFVIDGVLYEAEKFDNPGKIYIIKNIGTYDEANYTKAILLNPMEEKLMIERIEEK